MKRAFVLVIDALGVGAMPDAPDYGDSLEANTLANIDKHTVSLKLPTLEKLGAGNLLPLKHLKAQSNPTGAFGKLAEQSIGKDTTTGHWEMMGTILQTPFPTYPDGFPDELVQAFCEKAGVSGILANKPASGTVVINEYGEEHLKTGLPIVYTSADSVWQIATHIDVTPIETLYHWCEIARELLDGQHRVSRVIARPFEGDLGAFKRIGSQRHDYAVPPPEGNILEQIIAAGGATIGVGKIRDIFCSEGITHHIGTRDNAHGLEVFEALIQQKTALADAQVDERVSASPEKQFHFINLVETDMNYGHRRDVAGYAHALEVIDAKLAECLPQFTSDDLLIITGDHGCDPTAPGSDHTREYAPLWVYSPAFKEASLQQKTLGTRSTFADIGKAVLDWLDLDTTNGPGESFLPQLREAQQTAA